MTHNTVVVLIAIFGVVAFIRLWYDALQERAIRKLTITEWLFLTGISIFGVVTLLNAGLHFKWIALP